MLKICNGLNYIHENNIIHRDIKPENILLDYSYNKVKIADMGISCIDQTITKTIITAPRLT